jgi:phosphoribosylformylglycinamidine cyclo-ligase
VIYVRAILELLTDLPVHGLAHITGGGLTNLLRLGEHIGFEISEPLPVLPVFDLIAELGRVSVIEMWEVFNMGCGFCVVVPEERAGEAVGLLARRHPGTTVIGRVTDRARHVSVPQLSILGDPSGLRAA